MNDDRCKRCNFDDEFIIDYDKRGKEYVFCGNCGTVSEHPASLFSRGRLIQDGKAETACGITEILGEKEA